LIAANVPSPAPRQAPAARNGFGLIATAQASPLPPSLRQAVANVGNGGGWAVQVGAFSSENLARSAANSARDSAGSHSRAVVLPLAQGRSKLYRARVTGLSQSAAQAMCDRLRSRGGCMVLSPDTQG
jgi:cell division septation protein DedD